MTITLVNDDNMNVEILRPINFFYADHIFEEKNFGWMNKYWKHLVPNGIFAVHTDHKLRADVEIKLRSLPDSVFVNDIITVQRWGGVPKKGFPQKHDYILVYSNGEDFHWDASEIQIDKQMVNPTFNPTGKKTKTPDAYWEDTYWDDDNTPPAHWHDLGNFSTTSGERIKKEDGKNIHWQKPERQLYRLMTPFLRAGDYVVDPFVGSGTTMVVADALGCDGLGIEWDRIPFNLAKERLGL